MLNPRLPAPPLRTVASIRAALEAAGVEFTNGDEPGVKLRKGSQPGAAYAANFARSPFEGLFSLVCPCHLACRYALTYL